MTDLVLDASIAIAWCLEDEATATAEAALRRAANGSAVVPAIWPLEVANALLTALRRSRMTEAQVAQAAEQIKSLPIEVEVVSLEGTLGRLISLAAAHGLSVYDAAYLDLAMRRGLPLATIDQRLARAADAVGVHT